MTATSPPKHRVGRVWLTAGHRSVIAHALLYLGALAVLATGVDHIEQYIVDDYSTVPTIGTLFLLNFIGAIVLTAGLIAPLAALPGATQMPSALSWPSVESGWVSSLAGLFISETAGLFGFVEHGYRMAIVVAIVVEVAAVVFLAAFLLVNGTGLSKIRTSSR